MNYQRQRTKDNTRVGSAHSSCFLHDTCLATDKDHSQWKGNQYMTTAVHWSLLNQLGHKDQGYHCDDGCLSYDNISILVPTVSVRTASWPIRGLTYWLYFY